ncbi:MAG: hypothetical protein MJ245_02815 [Clostridia bacterium]|nr:hypothetical protein [Clostridia bacterium]
MSIRSINEINLNNANSNIIIINDNGVISNDNKLYISYIKNLIDDDKYNILNVDGEFLYKDKFDLNIFTNYNLNDNNINASDDNYMIEKYLGVLNFKINDDIYELIMKSRYSSFNDDNFINLLFESYYNLPDKLFLDNYNNDGEETNDTKIVYNKVKSINDSLTLFTFISCMNNAIKKGMFRQYNEFEHNDTKIKGRIDVSRHVVKNQSIQGKVCYTTREYTNDNVINKMILKTYMFYEKNQKEILKHVMQNNKDGAKHIVKLKTLFPNIDEYGVSSFTSSKGNTKIVNMVYKEYELLRKCSMNILKSKGKMPFDENDSRVSGIVYDVDNLWTNYIYKNIILKIDTDDEDEIKITKNKNIISNDLIASINDNKIMIKACYNKFFSDTYDELDISDESNEKMSNVINELVFDLDDNDIERGYIIFPYQIKVKHDHDSISNIDLINDFYNNVHVEKVEIPDKDVVIKLIPYAFISDIDYDEYKTNALTIESNIIDIILEDE